jgi:hypothetical protein
MIIQIFVLLDYLGGGKIIPLALSKLSGGTCPPKLRHYTQTLSSPRVAHVMSYDVPNTVVDSGASDAVCSERLSQSINILEPNKGV